MQNTDLYADRVIRAALCQWRVQHPTAADLDPSRWIWVSGYLAKWISQQMPADYAMRAELEAREDSLGITEQTREQRLGI